MTKKTKTLFFTFSFLIGALFFEILYIKNINSLDDEKVEKRVSFVKIVSLPDLAISTEANYIRHRSLTDLFGVFKDSPELTEYFPSSYAISIRESR